LKVFLKYVVMYLAPLFGTEAHDGCLIAVAVAQLRVPGRPPAVRNPFARHAVVDSDPLSRYFQDEPNAMSVVIDGALPDTQKSTMASEPRYVQSGA
jgi:hypothetical protein